MKAILTSTKLKDVKGSVELVEKMTGKSRKDINVAIINEASAVEIGDQRWLIDTLKDLADSFGGNIEVVHLLALSADKICEHISTADMLFVLGGNTDWLKIVFDKTGFSDILQEILKDKLYVGSSAGSMIIGHRPSDESQDKSYGEHENFGVKSYLDIMNFSILPHFHACYLKSDGDDWAIEESISVDYPIYAISDNAAVVVDDNDIYFIGSDYMKIVKGKTSF